MPAPARTSNPGYRPVYGARLPPDHPATRGFLEPRHMSRPSSLPARLAAGLAASLVLAAPAAPAAAQAGPPAAQPAAQPARRASTPGEQARFLAGLPVPPDSPLAALEAQPEWKDHVVELEKDWPTLGARLDQMAAWQAAELPPRLQKDANVVYLFGGPDAAHVVRLFPDAPTYLLAGLEPVGSVQAPETMKRQDVHTALDALSFSLRTTIPSSFFRTHEMGKDLQGHGIRGVLPVLYVFLGRMGAEVLDSGRFEIDAAGTRRVLAPEQKWGGGVHGVSVRFRFPGRPPQELLYVRIDLGDDALAAQPGFFPWMRTLGPANGFLKAASFILHDNHFSKTRIALLRQCAAILQEDSGIPFRAFGKDWDFTCFGTYQRPRKPFQRAYQADLDKACAEQPRRPLPFVIGYRKLEDSNLLLAVRRPKGTNLVSPAGLSGAAPSKGAPATAERPAEAAGAAPGGAVAPAERPASAPTGSPVPTETPAEASAPPAAEPQPQAEVPAPADAPAPAPAPAPPPAEAPAAPAR